MKKKRFRKGFTLIELLAVVALLIVILAIAVPGAFGIISGATKNAFRSNTNMVLKAIEYKLTLDDDYNLEGLSVSNLYIEFMLSSDNYTSLSVSKNVDNKAYIVIVGKNKWKGLTACGTYGSVTVVETGDSTCPV